MRTTILALVLLLLAPIALAQPAANGPVATLTIDVDLERREKMELTFTGLKRLARYEGLCLPQGATETRVHDDLGDVQYTGKDEDGRRVIGFTARGSSVTVDMTRGAPSDADHPLYAADANFCVPTGASIEVRVRVPHGHTLFFLSDEGEITGGREGRITHDGPLHVFYSYEAPPGGDRPLQVIEEPPFRLFVSPSLAPRAQEVAQLASGPYKAAIAEAGLPSPFDRLRVLFTASTPHGWEAGHYNGQGYVAVKEDTLSGDPTTGYPYNAVKVLVHEAFHAASFPYGRGPVEDSFSWWLEGTAKHAERQVDRAMPNATIHCQVNGAEVTCWEFDDRLKRAELDRGYQNDFTFDVEWDPSDQQSEDARRFYYGYSSFVVGAWIARNTEADYRAVWDRIELAFDGGDGCPCEDGWLERLVGDPQLFRPWAEIRASDLPRFEGLVLPFVKDEGRIQRELDARAGPLGGLGVPGAGALLALAALALVAVSVRRR